MAEKPSGEHKPPSLEQTLGALVEQLKHTNTLVRGEHSKVSTHAESGCTIYTVTLHMSMEASLNELSSGIKQAHISASNPRAIAPDMTDVQIRETFKGNQIHLLSVVVTDVINTGPVGLLVTCDRLSSSIPRTHRTSSGNMGHFFARANKYEANGEKNSILTTDGGAFELLKRYPGFHTGNIGLLGFSCENTGNNRKVYHIRTNHPVVSVMIQFLNSHIQTLENDTNTQPDVFDKYVKLRSGIVERVASGYERLSMGHGNAELVERCLKLTIDHWAKHFTLTTFSDATIFSFTREDGSNWNDPYGLCIPNNMYLVNQLQRSMAAIGLHMNNSSSGAAAASPVKVTQATPDYSPNAKGHDTISNALAANFTLSFSITYTYIAADHNHSRS